MTHFNLMGIFPETIQRDKAYFEMRGTFLDCRGPLTIHAESHWGFRVTVITLSHDIKEGVCGNPVAKGVIGLLVDRPVIVEKNAWIGSGALLYNCIIHEDAVVATGSVVRSCEVMPGTMVAGNPAKVIARWDDNKGWIYEGEKWRILS